MQTSDINWYALDHGNKVQTALARGGLICNIIIQGNPIFYCDMATVINTTQSVRGGIPILFPNAGELSPGDFFGLPRHGIARTSTKWKHVANNNNQWHQQLHSSAACKLYPYNWQLDFIVASPTKHSVAFTLTITNQGVQDMPIAPGLHPYFFVKNSHKNHLKITDAEAEKIISDLSVWSNGGTVKIDNPSLISFTNHQDMIVSLQISDNFHELWTWSLPGKDFVCFEPVSTENSLNAAPQIVKPGQQAVYTLEITLSL